MSLPSFGGRRRGTHLSTIVELTETEAQMTSRNTSLSVGGRLSCDTTRLQKDSTAPVFYCGNLV